MNDINSVVETGRLTNQAALKYSTTGSAIVNFSIAVNRSMKRGDQWMDEVSYFDVTAFGKVGEALNPYLTKGKQVTISGYLKQERWETNGQKRSRVIIIATDIQLSDGNRKEQPVSSGYDDGYGYN